MKQLQKKHYYMKAKRNFTIIDGMRNLTLFTTFTLLISICSFPASATFGEGSTGGGNALVCFDTPEIPKRIHSNVGVGEIPDSDVQHITNIEILDLFQTKHKVGFPPMSQEIITPDENEGINAYTSRIIERLKYLTPELYSLLKEAQAELPASKIINVQNGLMPINDVNMFGRIDSQNCIIATIATNVKNEMNNSKYSTIYVDERLFYHPKHSVHSMYVTYLHEIIYHVAKNRFFQDDAKSTRKLLGRLLVKNTLVSELFTTIKLGGFMVENDDSPNMKLPIFYRQLTDFLRDGANYYYYVANNRSGGGVWLGTHFTRDCPSNSPIAQDNISKLEQKIKEGMYKYFKEKDIHDPYLTEDENDLLIKEIEDLIINGDLFYWRSTYDMYGNKKEKCKLEFDNNWQFLNPKQPLPNKKLVDLIELED